MHRGHSPGITLTEHQCSGLKDEHRILILSQIILTYGDSLPNLLEYTRLSPSSTQSPTLTRRVLELRAKRVQGTSFRWGQEAELSWIDRKSSALCKNWPSRAPTMHSAQCQHVGRVCCRRSARNQRTLYWATIGLRWSITPIDRPAHRPFHRADYHAS